MKVFGSLSSEAQTPWVAEDGHGLSRAHLRRAYCSPAAVHRQSGDIRQPGRRGRSNQVGDLTLGGRVACAVVFEPPEAEENGVLGRMEGAMWRS